MKVKDLVNVTLATMPMEIWAYHGGEMEMLLKIFSLYFNGKLMVPEPIMEMEILVISINEDGLNVEVK